MENIFENKLKDIHKITIIFNIEEGIYERRKNDFDNIGEYREDK